MFKKCSGFTVGNLSETSPVSRLKTSHAQHQVVTALLSSSLATAGVQPQGPHLQHGCDTEVPWGEKQEGRWTQKSCCEHAVLTPGANARGWCQGTAAGPPSACKPADQPGRGFLAARASRGGAACPALEEPSGDHFTSWLEATRGTQAPEEGRRPGGRAEGFRHEVLHSHVTRLPLKWLRRL